METVQDIWKDLGGRVRRFVGTRVNDPHAADDITQDVLLKVQAHLGELPPEDKLPAWVFSVARNAVIDHYRARAVRDHVDVADVEPVADEPEAARQQALRDLTPCVGKLIARLPEPYREAMRLADVEGLSQQAVADRAGISLSGGKSRVQRARQQLREMILDCCKIERDSRGGFIDYETTERTAGYCGDESNGGADRGPCGGG